MSEKAFERDTTVYRKTEESKNLPRYVIKVNNKYQKGYKISKHKNCACKYFCDKTKTDANNLKDAIEFLDKLNKNEIIVPRLVRDLPLGIQHNKDKYKCLWNGKTKYCDTLDEALLELEKLKLL